MPLAVLALAVIATVPGAAASESQGGLLGAFQLRGSHGFRVLGLPYIGSDGRPSGILLLLSKRGESVTYSAPAEVSQTSVKADLGPIGEIDVQVVPTGVEESVRSRCGGKTYAYEGATFEGTIDLHGEEGFTDLEVTRTPVRLEPVVDIVCAGSSGSEISGHSVRGAELRLKQKTRQPRVVFQLNQNRPRGPVRYEAQIEEKRGPLRISRAVAGHLPGRTFSFSDDLKKASFRSAGPFSGSATFSATAGGEWSGDLAVDFPGRAGVALTGSAFSATLSHTHRTESRFGK